MSVAVVTSLYGDYDELVTPVGQVAPFDIEWVAVTDGKAEVPSPWVEVVEPRPGVSDRLAAKVAKTQPWLYTDATTIVWLDAAARLQGDYAVQHLVAGAAGNPITQYAHPDRDCVYTEAAFSAPLLKYHQQPIEAQAEHYRKAGHPAHWGLWATGCIVYQRDALRLDSRPLEEFGAAWLLEQVRWTDQDQVSEAVVAARMGLRPATLPGYLWVNECLTWAPHRRAD